MYCSLPCYHAVKAGPKRSSVERLRPEEEPSFTRERFILTLQGAWHTLAGKLVTRFLPISARPIGTSTICRALRDQSRGNQRGTDRRNYPYPCSRVR